jgi:putative chitinase
LFKGSAFQSQGGIMGIIQTVGTGGKNGASDVRVLQLLFNMAGSEPGLAVDGQWGPACATALASWRQRLGDGDNSPQVKPGDPLLEALRRALPGELAGHKLWAIMADASAGDVERFHLPLLAMFPRYGIDTPVRAAHFLAQIAHESGCLRYSEELASGAAYEGRKDLGNLEQGDGPRFKGRGLIQLTGRANYRQYGQACQRDFENADDPGLVASDPALAVDVAGWFWATRKLNELADRDDLHGITRRVNGGLNGLEKRAAYLARAKWLLGL